ncbi:MAG TPA: reverse transcriptase/maturase family protein [Candidatus Paceibacterota bacterium]|nr:reverse transcriptase/maturase family protein [Candidatus Paceibacterota bacterium]
MKIKLTHKFEDIISVENLLEAWRGFVRRKRDKKDVQEYYRSLMDNILELHQDLENHSYKHGGYQAFNISDPKPRNIHKATVRDRLLHHALHRLLYPLFDRTFIVDSYSCRVGKGSHKALNRFRNFAYRASGNHTKTAWVLKCDIKKFFANIDHAVLKQILAMYIPDQDILWLVDRIIDSFFTRPSVGLPLGNLTSQLLVNVYMNEFDQFIKHCLKTKYYIRYADDFVILSPDKSWLEELLPKMGDFLFERLKLELHPNKVSIRTMASGIDFLGWVHFPEHRVLRTTTKRRMFKRMKRNLSIETRVSYLGLLKHGNTQKILEKIGM